jgi:hypothetical protein
VSKTTAAHLIALLAACSWPLTLRAQDSTFTLAGTVVNEVTGAPVARALVSLMAMNPRADRDNHQAQLTDAGGGFRFNGLGSGAALIRVQRPGFEEPGAPTQLTLGPSREDLRLTIRPEITLTGTIRDTDGEPLPSANVQLLCRQVTLGRAFYQAVSQKVTDDRGRYRLPSLRSGGCYLRVAGPIATEPGLPGYPPTYYPGSATRAGATRLRGAAGDTVQADLTLRPEPAFRIRGKVAGHGPGERDEVELLQSSGETVQVASTFNQATGEFRLSGVVAGAYRLRVTTPGPPSRRAEIPLQVSGNLDGLVTEPVPGVPVTVLATQPSGEQQRRSWSVFLTPAGVESPWTDRHYGTLEANGQLILDNVLPGRYLVRVSAAPTRQYVSRIRSGSTELGGARELVISAGVVPAPIDITIADDGATLQGRLQGSNPTGQCHAGISSDQELLVSLRPVRIPPDGSFLLPGLPPGTYQLWAWCGNEEVEYSNREALEATGYHPVRVELMAGERKQVELPAPSERRPQ